MSTLLQDIRFGFRTLAKSPVFTVVGVVTLALGIGANTAVFSFVRGMLLRPLGYPDEDRLVSLSTADPVAGWSGGNVSIPDYQDWRAQNTTFEDLGICFTSSYNLSGTDPPEQVSSVGASASLLPVLGFDVQIGRAFGPEEDQPGRDRVVLLSASFRQRRFGGAADVVGTTITLNDVPHTVVGVLPAQLEQAWGRFDVWAPFAIYATGGDRGYGAYRVFGRLKPEVGIARAQAELVGIAARIAENFPETNQNTTVEVQPIIDKVVDDSARLAVASLAAAVAFVLLIACVNVANLVLARGTGRHRELAVRTTLGASRWRLARQLMTESTILALAGGGLGALLALWGVDSLVAQLPDTIPRRGDIAVDGQVLVFTVLLSLLTAVLFGLVPALQAARVDVNVALKDTGGSVTPARSRRWGRDVLVVGQVALALALLICAGLMIKSFRLQRSDDLGFDARRILTMRLQLPAQRYDSAAGQVSFIEQAVQQIRSAPGVASAAAAHILPFDGSGNFPMVTTEDDALRGVDRRTIVGMTVVTPGYFETLGVPVLSGRDFTPEDATGGPPVVIVSQRLARRCWPDAPAVGKRLKFGPREKAGTWFTVAGVVGNVRRNGLDEGQLGYLYLSHGQVGGGYMAIAARTLGDPLAATSAVQSAIWKVDPDQALYGVRSMEDVVAKDTGAWGVLAGSLSVFAIIALALAGVGLYGVMSYAVGRRTHEIGIRMALGAQRQTVLRLILQRSTLLTLLGVVVGVALACGLGQALKALMYKVSPTDPATFVAVGLVMILVGLLASYLPARRATRVNPVVALRFE